MREGACMGGETMLQKFMLRLIRNIAALATASPTLLFCTKAPIRETDVSGRRTSVVRANRLVNSVQLIGHSTLAVLLVT